MTTQDAWTCLWQSARYLREALFADWGLYSPWAVFLTTVSPPPGSHSPQLVVWAYSTASTDTPPQPAHEHPTAAAQAATALLDSIYTSPTRVDHLDAGVADLVVTVAGKLKLAQPIDRDHAQLLWRLAGHGGGMLGVAPRPGVSTTTRGRR